MPIDPTIERQCAYSGCDSDPKWIELDPRKSGTPAQLCDMHKALVETAESQIGFEAMS